MKRFFAIAIVTAALATGIAPAASAAMAAHHGVAKTRFGLPMCIATTWASNYYQQPKTRSGRCYLPQHRIQTPEGLPAGFLMWATPWTPRSWRWVDWVTTGTRSDLIFEVGSPTVLIPSAPTPVIPA